MHTWNNQPDVSGIQPVKSAPDQFTFGIPTPVYPSLDNQLPGLGAQPGFD